MKGIAVFLIAIAAMITGAANLPLAWVGNVVVPRSLEPRPQFFGTLWNGQIANIEGINPVNLSINPANLLNKKPVANFESQSPFLRFSGNATLKGSVSAIANGNITGLRVFDARFQSLSGTYDLSLNDVLVRQTCERGTGQISTNLLTENYATWQWRGPLLEGPITCEDGLFLASLTGSDGRQNITADFKLDLAGQYRADITVSTRDPQAEFILPIFGFEKTATGYSLSEVGAWR